MGIAASSLAKLASFAAAAGLLAAPAVACSSRAARAQHVSAACASARRIALTFDDGPNPPYTERVLDMLTKVGAHATFFIEGEAVEAHPALVEKELALGMAVGSHSYAHSPDLPTMSAVDFAADLDHADAAIRAATGASPLLYRSPYGHTSDMMLRELRRAGYVSIGWDVDSGDWSDIAVDEVVANVLDHAHPGAIVLMHDGGLGGGNPDRTTTLAALPRIVSGLQSQGYELVTVPDLTGLPATRGDQKGGVPEATCSAN